MPRVPLKPEDKAEKEAIYLTKAEKLILKAEAEKRGYGSRTLFLKRLAQDVKVLNQIEKFKAYKKAKLDFENSLI